MEIIIKMDDCEVIKNSKKEQVDTGSERNVSMYAKVFDSSSPMWTKDPEYNLMFLRQLQLHTTEKLMTNGYLFLNEVYDTLGLPRTKAGQVVGWIYDPKNPVGDNYVDCGIYDVARNSGFINGYENSILLDFNVDGLILDHLN